MKQQFLKLRWRHLWVEMTHCRKYVYLRLQNYETKNSNSYINIFEDAQSTGAQLFVLQCRSKPETEI